MEWDGWMDLVGGGERKKVQKLLPNLLWSSGGGKIVI